MGPFELVYKGLCVYKGGHPGEKVILEMWNNHFRSEGCDVVADDPGDMVCPCMGTSRMSFAADHDKEHLESLMSLQGMGDIGRHD